MRTRVFVLGLALAGLLPACATLPPGERDSRDRFERTNRAIYRFNDALDRGIAKPVAKGYVKAIPAPVRTGVGNFFRNLTYPTVIVNDLLQLKVKGFAADTARLVVNSTIGIAGLFDPASQLGLPAGDEDFGQTLGRWGMPAGPYVMLPLFGPSSVRDTAGFVADQFTDPKNYINDNYVAIGLTGVSLVDGRAELLTTEDVLNRSFDRYAFIRSAYLQRREYQVKDGNVPAEDFEIFEDETAAESPAK
ncbi:MAG: VacJ family lipoprotein [Steroidobacteraceae bacterium]